MRVSSLLVVLAFGLTTNAWCSTNIFSSVSEINAFFASQTAQRRPFSFECTIQHISRTSTTNKPSSVIVKDRSGDYADLHSSSNLPFSVGDVIDAQGMATLSPSSEPYLSIRSGIIVGREPPDPVLRLPLGSIDEKAHHLRTISITGIVAEVRNDEIDARYKWLILRDGASFIPVTLPQSFLDPEVLFGAKVCVEGVFQHTFTGGRKFSGPTLTGGRLDVVEQAPEDPFDAPPLDTRFYQSPGEITSAGRRTAEGQVLAILSESRFLLRTDMGHLVTVCLLKGIHPPSYGSMVLVSGFPDTNRFYLFLNQANVKPVNRLPPPEEPAEEISATEVVRAAEGRQSLNAHRHGELVTLTGTLRGLSPSTPSALKLAYVECDGIHVKVDYSGVPNAFHGIDLGSKLKVTGRCILSADNMSLLNTYPQLKDFTLVLRTPADIRITSRPPWWTPGRLLVIIGILLAAIVILLIRVAVQRRFERLKLVERTRLAVDLHDSLSQALAGLACQIAATNEDLKNDLPSVKEKLASADRMLKSCRTELKNCLFDLRNDTLNEKDLARAVRRTIENLLPYASISIRFNVKRSLLDDSTVHALLAIIRELVANAIRHGAADSIRIAGSIEKDRLLFSVSDDGLGFDPQTCRGINEGHFGLNGIRERVSTLKGTVEIDSRPGNGTYVKISLPVNAK